MNFQIDLGDIKENHEENRDIVDNSTNKRSAKELENDEMVLQNKRIVPIIEYHDWEEETLETEEIDTVLENINIKLKALEDITPDFTFVNKLFEMIEKKSGISKNDKNTTDLIAISRRLDKETQCLYDFEELSKKNLLKIEENKEKIYQNYLAEQSILKKHEKEVEEQIKLKKQSEKTIEQYSEILNFFGITVNITDNEFEAIKDNEKVVFDISVPNKYLLKSNVFTTGYNSTQAIYPLELSALLFKLLINSK